MVYWCSLNGFSLSKLDFTKEEEEEEEVEGGVHEEGAEIDFISSNDSP